MHVATLGLECILSALSVASPKSPEQGAAGKEMQLPRVSWPMSSPMSNGNPAAQAGADVEADIDLRCKR